MSKSRALYPNASYDYPSFSNLLRSVLGSNSSAVQFQEGYETEMAEAPLELKVEKANHSNNISPLARSDKFEQQSAPSLPITLSSFYNDEQRQVTEQQNSEYNSTLSHVVMETPPADGYSWRKYGQKQVKSSKNSRSYYRCSNTKCHAKKQVQRCDNSGRIIDVLYLGQHNHDYDKCNFSKGLVSSPPRFPASCLVDSVQKSDGEDISICSEARRSPIHLAESEQPSSSSSNGNVGIGIGIKVDDQNSNELESIELARHQKKSSSGITDSKVQDKHGAAEPRPRKRIRERSKETSIVVQTSTDGSISNDGYRWRKYGQKMVKGNTQLRSYYRCTSAGCPSRKHVEREREDIATATITYEGKHNHEMPLPKKQRSSQCLPPRTPPPLPIISSSHCKKARTFSTQKASSKWRSLGKEGGGYLMDEKVLELGGEKALESAQTLLSIGIEVRPY